MESEPERTAHGTALVPSSVEASPSLEVTRPVRRDLDVQELDRLLDLAVELQARIDRQSSRALMVFVLLLAAAALGGLGGLQLAGGVDGWPWIITIASGALLLPVAAALLRINRELSADLERLQEVVDIAREVEQALTNLDHRRPLTRARLRIRLAQFGLLPPYGAVPPVVRALLRGGL
ncbi:MAG: hypothetical protein AAGF11_54135 [Myxococcota bacterium]